ncbi:ABC transporter substrate-binding protein [Mobilicoccus caccae]|uniref:ABC transporter substrate-binding protein n=1 Tax=Mobilicoccus caccae TaxID=1859295 RepID=A0ABQ6INH0_9MICO|nr:sugar ABC transporter substrate-binding protein [Mobilicoccus caccae]GMA38758.1 ABC transporter substrate-binding protein [Mobilicoccus caccae]
MRHSLAWTTSVAVLAALGLSACGNGGDDQGSSGGGQQGGTVRVTLANHVWTDNVKAALPQFEKETGIKVELTQLGEDQLSDQYNVKLNAGSDEIDVMMYRPLQEGRQFAKNGYLADLTERVNGDQAFSWSDFQKAPVSATTAEGKVVGVPLITEREVLYYRKDLLQKTGLKVPKTLDELKSAAAKIKADNPDTAGFVARTARTAAVTQFSSFLYSYGGDFSKDGKAAVNTPEAKQAYAMYGGLIKDSGPANVSTDMSWPDAMAIFTQGKAGFYTEADSLYKNATDPAKSKVAENVGFAVFPAGPAGSKPYNIPSWALGVNEASKNQDNAWAFVKWATSKEQVLTQQKAGVPGARQSAWDDPAGIESYPADLAEAIKASQGTGVDHDRPQVVQVAKAREIVGAPIVDAITGKDSAAAADAAQTAFQQFLDDEL